jgi:hypothetical protein
VLVRIWTTDARASSHLDADQAGRRRDHPKQRVGKTLTWCFVDDAVWTRLVPLDLLAGFGSLFYLFFDLKDVSAHLLNLKRQRTLSHLKCLTPPRLLRRPRRPLDYKLEFVPYLLADETDDPGPMEGDLVEEVEGAYAHFFC